MAEKAIATGIKKAHTSLINLCLLGILAGAFIAFGAMFATTITAGAKDVLPFGIVKVLMGLAFSVGLVLVIVGGGELFTGNTLMSMAFASGKVSLGEVLRNWVVVYTSNFVGSILVALLVFYGKQHTFGHGAIGLNMLSIAESKANLEFGQAVALGVLCNFAVCMAVWLCYSCRTTTDRITAIILPITAFVAAGFEHSVANMYFIPMGLLVKGGGGEAFFEEIQKHPADFPHITWGNFLLGNLLPVTIGNIIGGSVCVGLIYWAVYIRPGLAERPAPSYRAAGHSRSAND
ncbi:formate transporter FocA [Chloroflexia bacterium SDU3-3]|nr:formate transporter FocA [Chloroflexia bacterium SDU3-3]